MQRRLFHQLGGWSVMPDDALVEALARIGETADDLSDARAPCSRARWRRPAG